MREPQGAGHRGLVLLVVVGLESVVNKQAHGLASLGLISAGIKHGAASFDNYQVPQSISHRSVEQCAALMRSIFL
jgi:hypothetical protein